MEVINAPLQKDALRRRLAVSLPLFVVNDRETIKLELKPYLQPFEERLAMLELRALLNPRDEIVEDEGLFLVKTKVDPKTLGDKLTFWQRLGVRALEPTLQTLLEFTQNGTAGCSRTQLHNARRLRYGPHDLHEYRGKFFPQLVRSLINIAGVPDQAIVCDPMCGSGTTACEALALGHAAIGADLNPLSVLISSVKANAISTPLASVETEILVLLAGLANVDGRDYVDGGWTAEDELYLKRWFSPAALSDLASIRTHIRSVKSAIARDFLDVCLSNIVRSVSWQKEDDLRVRKEVRPYRKGDATERFEAQVRAQLDRLIPYGQVLGTKSVGQQTAIRHGNAVNIDLVFPDYHRSVDVLITSPPYATALPYLDTDRLSLIVLGLLPRNEHPEYERSMVGTREVSEGQRQESWSRYQSRRGELPGDVVQLIDFLAQHNHHGDVGFRRRNLPALLARYFLDMLDAMRAARQLMRRGSDAFYVVGNNSTTVAGQRIAISTDVFLFEIGKIAGWKPQEMIPMELLNSRDIFRNNQGSSEMILHFKA